MLLATATAMLIYYRDGEKPIPRTVWLACLGWEAVRPQGRELPMRVPMGVNWAVPQG